MRRQVGASHFDIDATKGYATFSFVDPIALDWTEIADTADSAGYKVKKYTVVVAGTVGTQDCEVCGEKVPSLKAKGTEFTFELTGDIPKPGPVRLKAQASGWEEGHVTFEVLEIL